MAHGIERILADRNRIADFPTGEPVGGRIICHAAVATRLLTSSAEAGVRLHNR